MFDQALPVYVVDTHALYWYRNHPDWLRPGGDAVFRLAAAGAARIIVPAIVVAELYYLSLKLGAPVHVADLLEDINRSLEFEFSELGQAQLTQMEEVGGVTEMHDRLIAAEALVWQAPIITVDGTLSRSRSVETIW